MYRSLDTDKTLKTIGLLKNRIEERFPDSHLGKVCNELLDVGKECKEKAIWIAKPNYWIRFGVIALVVLVVAAIFFGVPHVELSERKSTIAEFVQTIESGINDAIFIGLAVFFLVTIENRLKRKRAIKALHELRALAHVIDLHQLTKDPGTSGPGVVITPSSPRREMTAYELSRYLDYCSEMLSLVGKIAALYAQSLNDTVISRNVNEIEQLTSGTSRKIWQKIVVMQKEI